jgi:putative hydrolase of the HAD superfamily
VSRVFAKGRVRAVVFDYFGTLTVHATAAARREATERVAAALGVEPGPFFEQTSTTFTERATGACGDLAETLLWVARRCGHEPSAEQLVAGCAERRTAEMAFAEDLRPDALATLSELRGHGLGIGVISDCTHELPECWSQLPLGALVDTVVFSVEVGARKPDPSLYLMACQALGVGPSESVYVGDGGSNELSGAAAVGMTAAQLVTDDAAAALVYDREATWTGPVVRNLSELPALLLGHM